MEDGKPLLIFILLVLSAFFSGSETALFSLSRLQLKKLENLDTSGAKRVLKMLRKPRQLLITLLLGNTFVNMAISSLATLIAIDYAGAHTGINVSVAVGIQVILTTALILLFGEIIPKLISISAANIIAPAVAPLVRLIQIILFPLVLALEGFSKLVSKKHGPDKHIGQRFTPEEFHKLIQSDSSGNSLEEHEKKMLVGLFRFKEAEISEIYVPRVKISAVEENQSLEELKELIIESGYSRIPVFRETIDDIIGIVYVKDLLIYPERCSIKEFIRPVWFVTENMKIQTLLNQFKSKKLQVAVVVDEYGGTSGIISLEDILEEIVGEIQDEYDHDETPDIVKTGDDTFVISGILNIRQFNQEFGVDIDPDEYDNIAQYLLENFNHVPSINETFTMEDKIVFEVLESDEKSIKRVQLKILPDED
ncbi:MAG TPA: hemolysin family protein [Candidatus Cloacimonadota bacterium]|nr:hemolysin family protein [Candidatus Cloacimonadota bacterium]